MPAVAPRASTKALSSARFAVFVTVAAWLAYVGTTLSRVAFAGDLRLRDLFDAIVYIVIVTSLVASALAYLLTRVGYLYRSRRHQRVSRAVVDDLFDERQPSLTVIVPSYREDVDVVRQTLLSAALQEYPDVRVVLLIDDPPNPDSPEHLAMLEGARALPGEVEAILAEPARRYRAAHDAFCSRTSHAITSDDMRQLAQHYYAASAWLLEFAGESRADHADEFLRRDVLIRLSDELAVVAVALDAANDEGAILSRGRMLQLHRRLAWTFSASLSSFERKQYVSLSGEPNKAMNLNSYIGLMGGRYDVHETRGGLLLVDADGPDCDLEVPDTDYVLTLDADSILLPEYCLRLVHFLEQPANERYAVAQTPYSSYPGAATRIERIAGATTDIQHIVHQGLTYYNATFWVGANAVLRKRALDDIREVDREAGIEVKRFIQDRTVIEDTESSVDLGVHGWRLYNYPERLSYSATPPDFGSLAIQRQRWANGGLLVIAKLRRYVAARRSHEQHDGVAMETFLRLNYLASIAWSCAGLIVLLAYPFNAALLSPFAVLTAVPYFVAMSTDLKRCGYKRFDVLRIYSFNLMLLPVNVSGVVKSIGQAIGGQKIAFARTPKVRNRTTAQISFVVMPYLIVAFSLFTVWRDYQTQRYPHMAFAAVNAVLCGYAIVAFIGIRNSIVDLSVNIVERLYRNRDDSAKRPVERDWATVLYYGAADDGAPASVATTAATLALVGNERRPVGEADDDLEPDIVLSDRATKTTPHPSDAVVGLLSEYLAHAKEQGRLVVRLDGSTIELVVDQEEAAS